MSFFYFSEVKILYALQGTGNGHISRARSIIPHLYKYGKVSVLISGTHSEVDLGIPVDYQYQGLGFRFGQRGGVDLWKTFRQTNLRQFISDIQQFCIKDFDLVINDFEPVSAWSAKYSQIPCIGLSHQAAFLSPHTPLYPKKDIGYFILKNYAPVDKAIGFHFKAYDEFIQTPIIRDEIRKLEPRDLGHYTVYLPAYGDRFLEDLLSKFPRHRFQIFSKHSTSSRVTQNLHFRPIYNDAFIASLSTCRGLITGGGFEGPAEALFLGKSLLSVPMRNQYEQLCNAKALEEIGVPVVWEDADFVSKISDWLHSTSGGIGWIFQITRLFL